VSGPVDVVLAPGAEENGLACMLRDLVAQNVDGSPSKRSDFERLRGRVAIVADDADVGVTLDFHGGSATVHAGIAGIPDVTIRGPTDAIMALSSLPSTTPLGLPIPDPRDREAVGTVRTVLGAVRRRELRIHGLFLGLGLVARLGRVLSIH
jgi:hypothetical protein